MTLLSSVAANDIALTFAELNLLPALQKSLQQLGYEQPSPIQSQTIPSLLQGRDLIGQAQTGTGKTAAFALPLLSRLDLSLKQTQVLILAPTRELAQQVAVSIARYGQFLPQLEVLTITGGQEYRDQLRGLRQGAHIVVGTPGRIIDHLERKSLSLNALRALVLDEADEMLRMGFIGDVERVLQDTPSNAQRVFFSATLPYEIAKIVNRYLVNPIKVQIAPKAETTTISQRFCRVEAPHKLEVLARILEAEPIDAAIVFVRTRAACTTLVEQLTARGIAAAALSGDLDQSLRERTVARLKKGKISVLIATDVAARGLDVSRITHVINYDLPHDTEAYVHRIGRTGRAGRPGIAITFVSSREMRRLQWFERATDQRIEAMPIPSELEIQAQRDQRFIAKVESALAKQGEAQQAVIELLTAKGYDLSHLAAVFAGLARADETPLQSVVMRKESRRELTSSREAHSSKRANFRGNAEASHPSRGNMVRYRVAVGHRDGIKPGQLVGALANEGGLQGQAIGRIDIRQSHSIIELPANISSQTLSKIARARVGGRALEISEDKFLGNKRRHNEQRQTAG